MIICKNCSDEVTNPQGQFIYYQPEYPDIEIGPYCDPCFKKVRICSVCQYPFDFSVSGVLTESKKYVCDKCK